MTEMESLIKQINLNWAAYPKELAETMKDPRYWEYLDDVTEYSYVVTGEGDEIIVVAGLKETHVHENFVELFAYVKANLSISDCINIKYFLDDECRELKKSGVTVGVWIKVESPQAARFAKYLRFTPLQGVTEHDGDNIMQFWIYNA